MSTNREQNKRPTDSADMLPSTSPTTRRSDAAIMADELSQLAERINWPRLPELKEFEQMAELILSAGYYSSEELADTSPTERQQLYKLLAEGRPGWSRLLRKILGAKAPPTEVEIKRAPPSSEIDIFGAIKARTAVNGIGELLRPRKELSTFFRKLCMRAPRRSRLTYLLWPQSYGKLHGPSRTPLTNELLKRSETAKSEMLSKPAF